MPRATCSSGCSDPSPQAADRPRSAAGDYTALVDAWAELLRSTLAALVPPGRPGALTVSVDGNGVGPPLRLAAGAQAEVWLHNGTTLPESGRWP